LQVNGICLQRKLNAEITKRSSMKRPSNSLVSSKRQLRLAFEGNDQFWVKNPIIKMNVVLEEKKMMQSNEETKGEKPASDGRSR